MRRATFVLASSSAAAAIAGALFYGHGSRSADPGALPTSTSVGVTESQALPSQPASPAETEPNVPAAEATEAPIAQSSNPAIDDRPVRRRGPLRDEATVMAELRKQSLQNIRQWYSFLLDDLGLTPQQREDAVAVLAELQVDGVSLYGQEGEFQKRGRTVGPEERHERIAAAIGERKLDEFLVLEVNLGSYSETQQIASLLRRKDVPLTEKQRDGVFEIVVDVRNRYPITQPPANIDSRSLEYIEHTLAQLDDIDRHIVELAPSVLSATQVAHLSEEYQWMARQRIDDLEMQKRRRAERPGEDFGWMYPARWNPH
jgi:hypothetical protein